MKSKILVLLLLLCSGSYAQKAKRIMLHCEVLGKQQGNVRYYHPIEGEYNIYREPVKLAELIQKELPGLVLIEPFEYLTDTLTTVYANSLRHYLDPSEMIYINWQMGWDTLNNTAKLDTFIEDSKSLRETRYFDMANQYFLPFFMAQTEVTNRQYREFCEWVVDSVMREAIYANTNPTGDAEIDENIIAQMLDHPETYYDEEELEWMEFDPSEPFKNRERWNFNYEFDWKKEIEPRQYIPLIESLYKAPNSRWYKRRELDASKFIYRFYKVDNRGIDSVSHHEKKYILEFETSVYPDTLNWVQMKWFPFNDPMCNMYFWHPAYDNYPVVNVSYEQVQAFIHWKNRMLQKDHPEIARYYEFKLPNTKEYEWCAHLSTGRFAENAVADDNLVPDLLLCDTLDPYIGFSELRLLGKLDYTEKVHLPFNQFSKKDLKSFEKYLRSWIDPEFSEEYVQTVSEISKMRFTQNYLQSGIKFLSNNVSEWMEESYQWNYEELIDAYINFKCFQNVDYCQFQRFIDQGKIAENDKEGFMIMGGNWFDERYETKLGVNTAGLYPKRFKDADKSFATVGFRLVLREKEPEPRFDSSK